LYVDRIVKSRGRTPPEVTAEGFTSGAELGTSIAEHYRRMSHHRLELPAHFDGDLKERLHAARRRGERTGRRPIASSRVTFGPSPPSLPMGRASTRASYARSSTISPSAARRSIYGCGHKTLTRYVWSSWPTPPRYA